MTATYLLDTHIVTALLKRDPGVAGRLRAELANNSRILISAVVYYEIKRSLLKRDALRQLAIFEQLVSKLEWLDVERSHWETATALWAECQRAGKPGNDADLLLAVQARQAQAVLVTDDAAFEELAIRHENWIVH